LHDIYHNNKYFKEKNKKANCWKKLGRNLIYRHGGGGFEADDDVAKGLKEEMNLLTAKFHSRHLPCCLLQFSCQHMHIILTLPD